jgi:ADP-ribose pyrophosphatase YjhB (NUDIX family)
MLRHLHAHTQHAPRNIPAGSSGEDCIIRCANCGRVGHVYKVCKYPISSFGVICFRVRTDSVIEYLMVQRKFSLCFVEFVRGNYSLQNRTYIMRLFQNMTESERMALLSGPFRSVWDSFWQTTDTEIAPCFLREYNKSSYQYNQLRKGYWLRRGAAPLLFFSLASALINTRVAHPEPEWGFPKGRRNINESDVDCALREFAEETALNTAGIALSKDIKPVEETFFGINRVNYRHTYYVAMLRSPEPGVSAVQNSAAQKKTGRRERPVAMDDLDLLPLWKAHGGNVKSVSSNRGHSAVTGAWRAFEHEIRSVEWVDSGSVCSRIRKENTARRHMFEDLNARLQAAQYARSASSTYASSTSVSSTH